uniref:Uncharacterized protein n=1 Tax=Oryza glumipatula TaxID=40148 RepID=A0A0D9Y2S9_9ORYZ
MGDSTRRRAVTARSRLLRPDLTGRAMAKAGARGAVKWWMKAAGMASAVGAKAAATDFATGSVSAAGGS